MASTAKPAHASHEQGARHILGLGIDDEVGYRIEDLATPEDYWTHRDDLGSVTSLTDINGAVVERYEYGDYGDVRIFDAAGVALAASSYNIHHLYTGRTVIPGTGLMDYRYRVYSPETGRFVQRDSVVLRAYLVGLRGDLTNGIRGDTLNHHAKNTNINQTRHQPPRTHRQTCGRCRHHPHRRD